MKGYEIAALIAAAPLIYDEDTGEVDSTALDALKLSLADKCEGIRWHLREMAGRVAALKSDEEWLADKRKRLQKEIGRLEDRGLYYLQAAGGEPVSTDTCTAFVKLGSWRVIVTDITKLSPSLVKEETIRTPIKKDIGALLKPEGSAMEGAHRERGPNTLGFK